MNVLVRSSAGRRLHPFLVASSSKGFLIYPSSFSSRQTQPVHTTPVHSAPTTVRTSPATQPSSSSSSSPTDNATTGAAKSNRQAFRDLPISPTVLAYLRKLGVGRVSSGGGRRKRTSRRHGSGSFNDNDLHHSAPAVPPPPFGPGSRVRVVSSGTRSKVSAPDSPLPQRPRSGPPIPEVALVGRSNVGKSTLLNALLYGNKGSRGLGRGSDKAIVSDRPGETRDVTVYLLSSSSSSSSSSSRILRLVDLPGYGFAHGSSGDFQNLTPEYLLHRNSTGGGSAAAALKRVLLLLDARHGFKSADETFLRQWQQLLLQEEQRQNRRRKFVHLPPLQAILTKCDLVSQPDLARQMGLVRQRLSDCLLREPSQLPVLCVSAQTGLLASTSSTSITTTTKTSTAAQRSGPALRLRGGLLELQRELATLAVPPIARAIMGEKPINRSAP